jgi:hypothetical protein
VTQPRYDDLELRVPSDNEEPPPRRRRFAGCAPIALLVVIGWGLW